MRSVGPEHQINMTDRFWLAPNKSVPWFWTFPTPAEYEQSHFPCERGKARRCTSCFMHWSAHHETLGFPRFNLHGRRPYSLADLALLRPGKTTKIVFHGDSTLLEMYDLAVCSMGRTPGVTHVPSLNKRVKFGTSAFKVTYSKSISHIEQKVFAVDDATGDNSTRLNLFFARGDHVMPRKDILDLLCSEADVLVVNWGAHYDMKASWERASYISEVAGALDALRECATTKKTTLVKMAHAAQNFHDTPYGWFTWGSTGCGPMTGAVEDADLWTRLIRDHVMPNVSAWLELVPTPWANEARAACPMPAGRRALHWVPYFDVSAAWWDFHRARVSRVVDCTHRMMVPDWGPPLWDALFLALFRDLSASCEQPWPRAVRPEGPSLADPEHADKFARMDFSANFVPATDIFSALQRMAQR